MDGKPGFLVTQSLHDALCRLRSTTATRVLWIDAICINQVDLAERNAQVHQMGEIFFTARNVVVWLGDCDPRDSGDSEKDSGECATDDEWHIVTRLQSIAQDRAQSWWNRVWVMQEVAFAKDLTVYLGPHALPWNEFCSLADSMQLSVGKLIEMRAYVRMLSTEEAVQLGGLLALTGHCHATNPLDYVFAVVGLLGGLDFTQAPDYALSSFGLQPDYSLDIRKLLSKLSWYLQDAQVRKHYNIASDEISEHAVLLQPKDTTELHYLLSYALENNCDQIRRTLAQLDLLKFKRSSFDHLLIAASNGHNRGVRMCLSEYKFIASAKDSAGRSSLSLAAANGMEDTVDLLLANGQVQVDDKDDVGRTPLAWAVYGGSSNIVAKMLDKERGKDLILRFGGETLLGWAVRFRDFAMVKTLLTSYWCDPNASDDHGRTPLWWAQAIQHPGIINFLIDRSRPIPGPSVCPDEEDLLGLHYWEEGINVSTKS